MPSRTPASGDGDRETIERATKILAAFHEVEPAEAVEMLRTHSERHGTELVDTARALVLSHSLLTASVARRPDRLGSPAVVTASVSPRP